MYFIPDVPRSLAQRTHVYPQHQLRTHSPVIIADKAHQLTHLITTVVLNFDPVCALKVNAALPLQATRIPSNTLVYLKVMFEYKIK